MFRHEPSRLFAYHCLVMHEMAVRGWFGVNPEWYNRMYRGKSLPGFRSLSECGTYVFCPGDVIFPEHDDRYLLECCMNLKSKGAILLNGKTLEEFLLELEIKGVQS